MKPWVDRPREVAFLLNPAFCATAVREVAKGYQDEASGSIELPLLFVAVPLALHVETRAAFPRSIATRLIDGAVKLHGRNGVAAVALLNASVKYDLAYTFVFRPLYIMSG